MAQDINTRTITAKLEDIIERRERWYVPLKSSWESLTKESSYKKLFFFPKELAEIVSLDESQKEKAEKAREWYKNCISEKVDDVVSIYEFSKSWSEMKGDAFRILYRKEFLASCVERRGREGSLRLCVEMKKLDYMLFTSDEMLEAFIERNCPILNMRIKRWKLLNELREYLQETRAVRKQSLHT